MIYKAAQLEKYIKKPDNSVRAWIIYGSNEGLMSEYVRKLTAAISPDIYDPFQVVYLTGEAVNADPGLLAGEFNAQSLMGGRRVIVIKDADNNLTKQFKQLFEDTKSDTLIVAYSSGLNKKSSLVKLGEETDYLGVVACYEDRDEDVFSTVRTALAENGISAGNEALQLLCARLSSDRKSNLSEIDKLVTYLGERKNVTPEDVLLVISDTSSSDTEDVCYAAAGGQKEKALQAYQKLLGEGVDPVMIVRGLTYHFMKLLNCLAIMENGEGIDSAVKKLVPRIIFFREPGFKKQLSICNRDRVFGVLELLYKCERDTRNANMPAEEVVSYALMQVASAAAAASAKLSRAY